MKNPFSFFSKGQNQATGGLAGDLAELERAPKLLPGLTDRGNLPTLAKPVSQSCTRNQFDEECYPYWCAQIGERPRLHRKQWEFVYIAQALAVHGMMAPGRKGLGFGVGTEPLPALFASRGAEVIGTDLEPEDAARIGWTATNQHALNKQGMNSRGLCPPDEFERNVSFRFMNMNEIPDDLGLFDFNWSACAFEHLGSIALGCQFIHNAARLLAPGGVAVHTTELNCSSNDETLDHAGTVLFRRRDFEQLARELIADGFEIEFNFNLGDLPVDQYIDVPPYLGNAHLKIQLERWVTSSIGLIVRRPL
jgi:SAM-dependent methyltransferase